MTRFLRNAGILVRFRGTQVLIVMHGLIGLLLLSNSALADTPLPDIHEPEGKGIKCIQPEDEIRRNHMNYILHERDETMHEGIRNEPESLANCINCHVFPDENGEIPDITSNKHFCNACHQYAAVQIDCFQCHADRPQKYIKRNARMSRIQQPDIHATGLAAGDTSGQGVNQ